jgi:hypothetical protein
MNGKNRDRSALENLTRYFANFLKRKSFITTSYFHMI